MKVFIPTRSRIHKQITWSYLKDIIDVRFVVPKCEAHLWDNDPIVVPDSFKISDIRQHILESEKGRCIVIDDDLRFFKRSTGVSLVKATPQNMRDLFKWVEEKFDEGYIHGGISTREGNNYWSEKEHIATRVLRFHFYDSDKIKDFYFTDIEARQDFHFTLSLLRRGFPNIVSHEFAQGQDGSATEGGCSWYRDKEVLERTATQLMKLHPKYVSVVDRWTEPNGRCWGGWRVDVRIQWKKAYENNKARRENS